MRVAAALALTLVAGLLLATGGGATSDPGELPAVYPAPPAPWAEVAAAVRRGDVEAVRRLLAEDVAAGEPQARMVLGLAAHAGGRAALCATTLRATSHAAFDDWRLLILADCYAAQDRLPAAAAALDALLERHPTSPLRSQALLEATAIARRQGDWLGALRWIAEGRSSDLPRGEAERLEREAWAIADEQDDPALRRAVARRLLIRFPLAASQLQVVEVFRQPSGAVAWRQFMSAAELLERSRSLLAVGVSKGALETLEAVPEAERGFTWSLEHAAALTAAREGARAWQELSGLRPADLAAAVALEQRRAEAALAAARVWRRGPVLPAAERDRYRQRGRDSLRRLIERSAGSAAHRDAAIDAHRKLLRELVDDEDVDAALGVLRSLHGLDPGDESGARFLWQRGWHDYQERNYTGAIGFWSELETIFPASRHARSARYWTGRAHDQIGNPQRAAAIYREVAAVDTDDFYRRHARARLGSDPRAGAVVPGVPREPWPWDETLERARWLSDRGFDALARTELAALGEAADGRAAAALEAVILAREGDRRESIRALARAFSQLGRLDQASAPEAALKLYYPVGFQPIVNRFARERSIPAPLLFAMIRQESAFDTAAVSRSGARGLMQLMPATGRELAQRLGLRYSTDRLADPEFNIRLGATYFSQVLEMFDGNEQLALAGYNGGPYRIRRWWREAGSGAELDRFVEGLSLEETRTYVKRILLFSDSYDRLYRQAT